MWWLILPAILVVLLLIPVGITGKYQNSESYLWLRIGVVHFSLYPKKRKRSKISTGKRQKNEQFEGKQSVNKKPSGSVSDYFPLFDLILDFLDTFRRKLRINNLVFKLTLGGEDPCDLSVNYGRAWTVLGNLQPHLDRYFVIRKRDLEILCDYTSEKSSLYAELDMTLTVGNILTIAGYHGVRFLRKFLKIINKRKGGAMT